MSTTSSPAPAPRRSKNWIWWLAAIAVIAGLMYLYLHQPAPPLLVQDGTAYHLFSFDLNPGENGEELYLITFGYQSEYEDALAVGDVSAVRRGTILVPKNCCVFDNTLPLRSVKWEASKVEGKEYRIVRLHPLHRTSSDGGVPVIEEPPLRQQK